MTKDIDYGGSAFPGKTGPRSADDVRAVRELTGAGLLDAKELLSYDPGMSLRDYFAAQALPLCMEMLWETSAQEIETLARRYGVASDRAGIRVVAAAMAFDQADAMLEARK